MASVDVLLDLPMAWLYRLSTSLTAASAARLRSTCKLLREVIDATWEPDPPVPPHRRSVPLTFEQVKAQLPPAQPRPPTPTDHWEARELERAAEAERYEQPDRDGCDQFWQQVFGPALTRLTANQAVNMLEGKPLLGFVDMPGLVILWHLDKHSTATDRLKAINEMTFHNRRAQWPPQAPAVRVPGDGGDSGSESDGTWVPGDGRGECGWSDGYEIFLCEERKPSEVQQLWAESRSAWSSPLSAAKEASTVQEQQKPFDWWVSTKYERLLVTTDSSCREATPEEVQEFVASDSPDDGDRFDVYLADARASRVYVFLGPVEPRLTGRPKAASGPAATVAESRAAASRAAATILKALSLALMHPLVLLAVATPATQLV